MLAGLIFATEDAEGTGGGLAATLPFGGMTLLEYQARLLIAAGAGHLLIAVTRMTPPLLGAVNRIAKRGVPVDMVRSAEEVSGRLHPLARVIVLADALVTTDQAVHALASVGRETILVTDDPSPALAVERIDSTRHWAGMAMVDARRVAEVAALPRDYDFQSSLLRLAAQGGAEHLPLSTAARRAGHGVDRHPDGLASRSNGVLLALANQRIGWADRYVFTPLTRILLPQLVRRNVADTALLAVGGILGLIAVLVIALGWPRIGIVGLPLSVAALTTGSLLSGLRGNDRIAMIQDRAIQGVTGLVVAALAIVTGFAQQSLTAPVLAAALIAVTAIGERVPGARRPWYGGAPLYALLLTPWVLAGVPVLGLGVTAIAATATLAALVETLRKQA
ncbi:hypothetical protein NYR55_04480 [Sphingomonas sp. BGYR3]|uniref:hypothetical protein n=1 Tax=Sphingomonas sp. BGYR3 TaxID=2975483 RepID=UPI0021A55ADC|nr:hypothetical protein [Sphingomonas sp. BGYR3]MDG5487874.1 hypothetical protein [Sphingomonas sp. BGYR3]